MKNIKNLFLVIIFLFVCSEFAEAQTTETIFIIGDTTETVSIPGNAKGCLITLKDSSDTKVDTCFAFIATGSSQVLYGQVGLHDLNATATTTNVVSMIPGDGLTKSYYIPLPSGTGNSIALPRTQLVVLRSNESTNDLYAPRTKCNITFF